jgi:hypothetical protein
VFERRRAVAGFGKAVKFIVFVCAVGLSVALFVLAKPWEGTRAPEAGAAEPITIEEHSYIDLDASAPAELAPHTTADADITQQEVE